MSFFKQKTAEEKYIEKEMRALEQREKRAMRLAQYGGVLGGCRDAFERTISIERLNALKRRRENLSDATQKVRIHDACVGLLAVQEAEFELSSAQSARDEVTAQRSMKRLLSKLYRLSPQDSVSKKDYVGSLGMEADNTADVTGYSERAGLVDDRFVEWIIEGFTLKECLNKSMPTPKSQAYKTGEPMFTEGGEDTSADISFLREDTKL